MNGPAGRAGPTAPEVVVDARGLVCPLPVIRLARTALGLPAGTVLRVLVTDPAARHDVPAWARMRGHTWLGAQQGPGAELALRVRLGPGPGTAVHDPAGWGQPVHSCDP